MSTPNVVQYGSNNIIVNDASLLPKNLQGSNVIVCAKGDISIRVGQQINTSGMTSDEKLKAALAAIGGGKKKKCGKCGVCKKCSKESL